MYVLHFFVCEKIFKAEYIYIYIYVLERIAIKMKEDH